MPAEPCTNPDERSAATFAGTKSRVRKPAFDYERELDSTTMDPDLLREALSETEQHIADGERMIAEQRTLAKEAAERGARYADEANRLLSIFEKSLAVNVAERDRILRELQTSQGRR